MNPDNEKDPDIVYWSQIRKIAFLFFLVGCAYAALWSVYHLGYNDAQNDQQQQFENNSNLQMQGMVVPGGTICSATATTTTCHSI